ncbi:bolA-like protein 3 [Babylonia areolata]|uniref:bolA-like protein 3 n=1 Tax=Babylonia areolata TaxID=304850 RepID=UPI003FD67CA2
MLRILHLTRQISRCAQWRVAASPHQHVQTPAQCQQRLPLLSQTACGYSRTVQLTDGEKAIVEKLKSKFPGAKVIEVSDVSGGCGAMYQISIEAEEFKGKRTMQQHRLVNEALAEEIKEMHGLQLNTRVPGNS